MAGHLYIFEKLLNASSREEIVHFMAQQCDQLGYKYYFYSPLFGAKPSQKIFRDERKIIAAQDLSRQNIFTTYPSSWVHRYQEARHAEKDPVLKLTATSHLPVFWNDPSQCDPKHVVFDEARQHGLAGGITVPVCDQNGGRSLFSIATETAPKKSSRHQAANAGMVLLTSLYLHEAVQRHVNSVDLAALPQLTTREKDCLQWAANGKTSWEIANILSISERTVIFHITNATKKLNATNRRQAVARAISLRLISP